MGCVLPGDFIITRDDLAAVAILAIREFRQSAQHAPWRPVRQIAFERNRIGDGPPRHVATELGEPKILLPDKVKRKEAEGAVFKAMKERLCSAPEKASRPDHRVNLDVKR